MSNKISIILSLVIFFQSFILSYDILHVQMVSARLAAESNYINSLILKNRGIDDEVLEYVDEVVKGNIICLNNCVANEYEPLTYKLTISYRNFYHNQDKSLSITRSVLISYSL